MCCIHHINIRIYVWICRMLMKFDDDAVVVPASSVLINNNNNDIASAWHSILDTKIYYVDVNRRNVITAIKYCSAIKWCEIFREFGAPFFLSVYVYVNSSKNRMNEGMARLPTKSYTKRVNIDSMDTSSFVHSKDAINLKKTIRTDVGHLKLYIIRMVNEMWRGRKLMDTRYTHGIFQ